jgi:Cof subfamily protein (haloacid dehalogenase superfamily)
MDLSKIKLVVMDMDGTLLNSKSEVSDQFFNLYKKLTKYEIQFVAASGRQYHSIIDKLATIKDDITIIAENGAYVAQQNQELVKTILPIKRIHELIPILRSLNNIYFTLCGKKSAYIETYNDEFITILKEYYSKYQFVKDLTKVKDDEFFKIAVYHFKNSEKYIYPAVKHFEKIMQVKVSGKHWVDISQPNANKGYALQLVQDRLGISVDETMVFGDYNNDLEMLRLAHFSYAMENAHPNVKKEARYTTKSNDSGGVEEILEKLLNAKIS